MSSAGPTRDPRSALSAALHAAASGGEPDVVLQGILDAAVDGLGASAGAIFLADPDRPGLTLVASRGLPDVDAVAAEAQTPASPFAETASARVASYDRPSSGPAAATGSYAPLILASNAVETLLGVIGLTWDDERTSDEAGRATLLDVAIIAALAAERARLASTAAERSEWFERMAHTDPLTGLANERTVARILELELARAGRQGSEVSLAVFDVDDFRATNASDGHEIGDDVLRRVAAVLAESVRLVDTVGRIGGDEFVLVAPGSAGAMVARRVQEGIAALPAVAGRSISVSAGVARFPADGADSEALIAASMAALAEAKAAGHGTVAESEAIAER